MFARVRKDFAKTSLGAERTLPLSYVSNPEYLFSELKKKGVTAVVTGDVYLEDSRNWMLRVCREAGVGAVMPLWGKNSKDILNDFIASGFF